MDIAGLAVKIVGASADAALSAAGLHGGAAVTEALLTSLLGLADEQAETLSRIEGAVTRLVNGPWQTARLYLDEARLPGRTPMDRRAAVAAAADKMRDALGLQDEDSLPYAYAAFELALLQRLLGEEPITQMYARQAAEAAVGYLCALTERRVAPPGLRATRAKVIAGGMVTGVLGGVLTIPIGGTGASVGATAVRGGLSTIDQEFTAWAQSVEAEVDDLLAAATVLCGQNDPVLVQTSARRPQGLHCERGVILAQGQTRVGFVGRWW